MPKHDVVIGEKISVVCTGSWDVVGVLHATIERFIGEGPRKSIVGFTTNGVCFAYSLEMEGTHWVRGHLKLPSPDAYMLFHGSIKYSDAETELSIQLGQNQDTAP